MVCCLGRKFHTFRACIVVYKFTHFQSVCMYTVKKQRCTLVMMVGLEKAHTCVHTFTGENSIHMVVLFVVLLGLLAPTSFAQFSLDKSRQIAHIVHLYHLPILGSVCLSDWEGEGSKNNCISSSPGQKNFQGAPSLSATVWFWFSFCQRSLLPDCLFVAFSCHAMNSFVICSFPVQKMDNCFKLSTLLLCHCCCW